MTRLAIFDLDGTLLNTIGDLAVSCNAVLALRGLPQHSYEDYCRFVGNGIMRLVERALPEALRTPYTVDAVRRDFVAYYLAHIDEHTLPYEGIPELLDELQRRGVRLAVATASRREHFLPCLSRHGVLGFFDAVVTTDDAGCGKSSPAIFELAARQLSLPPQSCAVLEDTLPAARTAARAGCVPFGVYEKHSAGARPEMELVCRGYFETLFDACSSPLLWKEP